MISESISKRGKYMILFENFNGAGWADATEKIIAIKINPDKIEKKIIEQGWYYSEFEFHIEKESCQFIYHLDDDGIMYLLLDSKPTEENKQKLRDWATIIATEVELLKS